MSHPTDRSPDQEGWRVPPELEWADGFFIYRGTTPFDQLPFPDEPRNDDFEWAWNDPEVQRHYAGLIVVVHARKVWGAGVDEDAAWDDANRKPGCPPENEVVFVPVCGSLPGPGAGEAQAP